MDLQRQTENGYELSYPLQQLINKIGGFLMISTTDILKFLFQEYNLKIDQSLLFKYEKMGLVEKEQKINYGKAGGVKTYWKNSAKYLPYYIKQLLAFCTLQEISEFRNLLYNFDELKITEIFTIKEVEKFQKVIIAYGCSELDFGYGFELKAVNGKMYIPLVYVKKEKVITEIHLKLVEVNEYGRSIGKPAKDIKAYKEVIFSKKGIKVIN
ncbi:MAG: hypothetical protein PHC87_06205 [Actinomycetota bacterium]|nr:hypothetical protein [Actinomycetota bacterium]